MFCQSCGNEIAMQTAFCGQCGTKVSTAAPSAKASPVMRARIIQYNASAGTGIAASADGRQYDFIIRQWRSDTAPASGQTIEVTLDDNGGLATLVALPPDVLAREKASQIAQQLGAQLSAAGAEGGIARRALETLSVPVAVSYVIYLVSTTLLNAVSIRMMFFGARGVSLWDISSMPGGGGLTRLLLLLAFGSILVPLLWRDRRAWFALLLPLTPLLAAVFGVGASVPMNTKLADIFSILEFGGYTAVAAALALGYFALKRAALVPATAAVPAVPTS